MRALFKENIIEALIGAGVLLLAIWFVTFAYDRTQRGGGSAGGSGSAHSGASAHGGATASTATASSSGP